MNNQETWVEAKQHDTNVKELGLSDVIVLDFLKIYKLDHTYFVNSYF